MSPMSSASPVPPVLPMSPPMPVAPDTTREGGRRESSGSNGSNGMIGTSGLIGSSVIRPDAVDKARGDFAFSSDLWAEGMLWGKVLRSPHPSARILSIDTARAQQMPGVMAVLTWADLPGDQVFGLDAKDQPVFAHDVVRYAGEPIAAVAATHPELARQAVDAIVVDFEPAIPLVDPDEALSAPATHEAGNVFRHITLRHGDIKAEGDVVVEGTYEVGMQDQAFMGPESGLAIPSSDGSVDLYISTQWLHVDRDQVAACLGLPPELVRLHLAGVGGRVWCTRGYHHSGPALPSGSSDPSSGEDGVFTGRVLSRSRSPSPGSYVVPPSCPQGWHAGKGGGKDRSGWGGLYVLFRGGHCQRDLLRCGTLQGSVRGG